MGKMKETKVRFWYVSNTGVETFSDIELKEVDFPINYDRCIHNQANSLIHNLGRHKGLSSIDQLGAICYLNEV